MKHICRALLAVIITVSIITISFASAEMPSSFYKALIEMKNQDILCVKNYDSGASVTESYQDFEHLDKETQIVSRSYNTSSNKKDYEKGNASLEVLMNSNVIGKAHIAWQSRELMPGRMSRHVLYGHAAEDLTGTFDVEKVIRLLSNSTLKESALEWLPCG